MVAEFARLFPRSIFDAELTLLVKDTTSQLYHALVEIVAGQSSVLSVAGRKGDVVLTKADVGLDAVDNIAAADLPVSTATQAALDLKRDSATPIRQDEVENLPADLAARVKTVNGAPPDDMGNVVVDTGQSNFITKPEALPEDKEVLTWVVGIGWTPVSIQEHLLLGAGDRILPDPATAAEGDTITLRNGVWVAEAPTNQPLTLTSPDGAQWALRVANDGTLSATAIP